MSFKKFLIKRKLARLEDLEKQITKKFLKTDGGPVAKADLDAGKLRVTFQRAEFRRQLEVIAAEELCILVKKIGGVV